MDLESTRIGTISRWCSRSLASSSLQDGSGVDGHARDAQGVLEALSFVASPQVVWPPGLARCRQLSQELGGEMGVSVCAWWAGLSAGASGRWRTLNGSNQCESPRECPDV
eukprot:3871480-Prymnesium_polylepis.1